MDDKRLLNNSSDASAASAGEDAKELQNCMPGFEKITAKRFLMLHSCCGPCSTSVIERLKKDYRIEVFFYNPNITDTEEYDMRLEAQKSVIRHFNMQRRFCCADVINLNVGDYLPEQFFSAVSGLEGEPEGGARCTECFRMRLEETAREAVRRGCDLFATTLTVSPHKNYELITQIGREIGEKYGIRYLDIDFKKQNGFNRSVEISKEIGIYRQKYCGCEFSKWWKE